MSNYLFPDVYIKRDKKHGFGWSKVNGGGDTPEPEPTITILDGGNALSVDTLTIDCGNATSTDTVIYDCDIA